jgi:hypothetical protein
LTQQRRYRDRILSKFGVQEIWLEKCFERTTAPPPEFLRWLICNPERMTWPTVAGRKKQYGPRTQLAREMLFGRSGIEEVEAARGQALMELERVGVEGSARKWWAFEGFTEVDCYLETDRLLLFIEGKRNEGLSCSTDWYPSRSQLVRNLEVASHLAGNKEFAVLLIEESADRSRLSTQTLDASLPHLDSDARAFLGSHVLEGLTWSVICRSLGINYDSLPDRSAEVAGTTTMIGQET